MSLEAWWSEDSKEVSRLRISMLVFISPLAWPFWPVAMDRAGLERRLVTFRPICDRSGDYRQAQSRCLPGGLMLADVLILRDGHELECWRLEMF